MYDTFGIFPVRHIPLNYVYVFAMEGGNCKYWKWKEKEAKP